MASLAESLAIGTRHHQAGQWAEAEKIYRQILVADPNYSLALHQLGILAMQSGKFAAAVDLFDRAIHNDPSQAALHAQLGEAYRHLEQLTQAEKCYRHALKIQPNLSLAHMLLGIVLRAQGRDAEAAGCFRSALDVDPLMVVARYQLGTLLQARGHLDEALACFEEVIRLDPHHALAHMGRGCVLQTQGKFNTAIGCYEDAIRLDRNYADAYNNLGIVWSDQGRRDEGIACCRRAIELRADYSEAHGNLGVSLQYLGRLDEAIFHCRKAVELEPANAVFHSNLVYLMNYHPAYDGASVFSEHRAWGQRHADPLTTASSAHRNDQTVGRRLRVGYVSPNFLAQAVNCFSEPILASHDHAQFEVFCYSDVSHPDDTTRRLQGYADHWRDIVWQSDQQASDLVRRDQIDILVDLTGHICGGKRLLAFARKPAPIQVTYIGYQNTTGMLAMDYRLTDDYADPPGTTDAFYTEKLVRLPRTFFCYLPSRDAPSVNSLPALANGYVTFGSINNFNKITPEVLKTWAEILSGVPQSRLLLRADMTDSLRRYLGETFESHGIGAERLELVNRLPHREYLELIGRVDIGLDPFPFNGHTTTCDCLWQGVPVVTLSGNAYASRFGGSGLVTLGLDELIARTPEQYLEIAGGLAGNLDRLAQLRGGLRERMSRSPLLDFQAFTRNLEIEYRRMWATWCVA